MTRALPSYKELTLQQLRCFCETARLGSFVASAAAMGVSNPTVWKQVHALERILGAQLVETHRRGCYLTPAGQLLLQLAGPSIEALETLRDRFQASLDNQGFALTMAVTPRILVEDLTACLVRSQKLWPRSCFRFLELPDEEVAEAVAARRADLGFSPVRPAAELQRSLRIEPAYPLEYRLVTPRKHPLAQQRSLRPQQVSAYPIVNMPDDDSFASLRDWLGMDVAAERLGFRVQACFAGTIRRLVELGFGIGFIPAPPGARSHPRLCERSLRQQLGYTTIYLFRRRGGYFPPLAEEFVRLVRQEYGSAKRRPDK